MKQSMQLTIKGFILKDYLLSLLVMMILLPLIVSALGIAKNYQLYDVRIQDELSIAQLRERLLVGKDFKVADNCLTYRVCAEEWHLKCENEQLYLAPGYQLFLDDIQACVFKENANNIEIEYSKGQQNYRWPLVKK